MTDDRAAALAFIGADSCIEARLDTYVDLLARWRKATNLISESAFSQVWTRHIADSAQLLAYAPLARRWVDLGSGAGFPGMVIAIQLAEIQGVEVHCIESDQRKCAFLRAVARATAAPAHLHATRIEALDPTILRPVEAVTARALAPLPHLVNLARPWLTRGAIGIFPRGRTEVSSEPLSDASEFRLESLPSKLDRDARIVRVAVADANNLRAV
ncbi:MAG TPA: 16S rRNA (guanine(527)-N(7))-methyltransferase RsmG [Roseiarcus sp.]